VAKSAAASQAHIVALTLDPHVHAHFEKLARADDRTLAKYLARHLRAHVDEAEAKRKHTADDKF